MQTHTTTSSTSEHNDSAPLPKRVENRIAKLRKPFAAFVSEMEGIVASRTDLAPQFMQAYASWQKATGGNFVTFCRVLDPSIPEDREGYRRHRAYAAADYLRRVASGSPQRRQEKRTDAEAPATPLDAVARTLAILLPLVPNPERIKLWERITAELHWTERQVTLLRQRAESAPPLVEMRTPRGTAKDVALVVH